MPGVGAEYARLPVTELADLLSSEEEDDLYTRPPRRHRPRSARNGKPSLQAAPAAFREAATRPVKRYQLLDEEDALGALQATPDIRQPRPLSLSKKACLVTSFLLILTGVSVAVWLVPCQWYGCSDPSSALQQSSVHRDYEVMFPGIVVTTRLVVAPTVYLDSVDVVFGFRRQDSAAGGVMVVASSSGDKLWQQDLYEAPVDLQCGGVDLNGNGIFECLATSSSSMMALINMDRRRVEWYLHEHNSTSRPLSLLPPLLLSDLTSDGVADLLAAGLIREEGAGPSHHHQQPPRTQLMIIDGATGMVLNRGPISDCPVMLRLSAGDLPSDVTLECMSAQTGVAPRTESLTALTEELRTDDMADDVRVFTTSEDEERAGDGRTTYQLQLENSGVCPRCRGRLTLLDETGAAVWSSAAERSRLHSVHQFSHRNHSGVIYKLWQYPTPEQQRGSADTLRRFRRWWRSPPAPEEPVPTLTFEEESSVTQTPEGIQFQYRHPGLDEDPADAARVTPEPDDGSVPEFFTESVHVVWPAEDGELSTQQLDSVQVTRFCRGPQQQRCEPQALADNINTVAVVDVGGDLDLDLVTVTSLFVPEGEVVVPRHRHQCSLQTRLRKRQLYGAHWQETLPLDPLSETVPGGATETASETVPTEETLLP